MFAIRLKGETEKRGKVSTLRLNERKTERRGRVFAIRLNGKPEKRSRLDTYLCVYNLFK